MRNKPSKQKRKRAVLITLGCCCLIAAAALDAYNKWDASRAAEASEQLTANISSLLETGALPDDAASERDQELEQIDGEGQESTVAVGGYDISGILSVPAINIRLAIINEWSYPNLTVSACRYSGAPDEQMILLAHNYKGHFGSLDKLVPGDQISYTDVGGVIYEYEVTGTEIWATGQLREIVSGDTWNLTLFTCTYGGNDRVVVRCIRI